jgi:hypothetical protein
MDSEYLDFLSGLTDEEYDDYTNSLMDEQELSDHVANCTKAERDEYCKICMEY